MCDLKTGVEANSHEDYVAGLGKSVGRWLSLQMSGDNLKQALGEIADGNGAWEICDFEPPFIINRDDDVFAVNETAAAFAGYDYQLVYALC